MGKSKRNYLDPASRQLIANVALPNKIRCYRCEKHYPPSKFSQNQLDTARKAIRARGINANYQIACSGCASGQLFEIQCTSCDKVKGRNEFSNVQQRKPDTAKCFECVEEQLATDPVDTDTYEGPVAKLQLLPDDSQGNYPDYFTNNVSTRTRAGNQGYDEPAEGGGVKLGDFGRLSINAEPTASLIDTDSHTSNGYGGPVQSRATSCQGNTPITRSTVTSSGAFGSDITERSRPVTRNGWAKIKAYVPPKVEQYLVPGDDWISDDDSEAGNNNNKNKKVGNKPNAITNTPADDDDDEDDNEDYDSDDDDLVI